ncbi:hypothetical protein ACHAQA_009643 [Verticillium albo-atrum]
MANSLPATQAPSRAPALRITYPASLEPFDRSVSAYLQENYPPGKFDGLATSALIFDSQNRILLLRRAAHDSMPGLWEPPGGAADEPDGSLFVSCARELWEEAGLLAAQIVRVVSEGEGKVPGSTLTNRTGDRSFVRFSFEVGVAGALDVKLDANEHDAFVWATEEEIRSGQIPGIDGLVGLTHCGTREVVYDAFRRRRDEVTDAPSCLVEREAAVV